MTCSETLASAGLTSQQNISLEQIQANCGVLIIAGSETTATLLSGVTFLLLQRPETLKKLTEEVRTTFKTEGEIDLTSVNKLTYMFACLDEALRMYPPVPLGLPRLSPKGGAQVSGHFIPQDVSRKAPWHATSIVKDLLLTAPLGLTKRPSAVSTTGPSTTARKISRSRLNSVQNGGCRTPSTRRTNSTPCSRFRSGRGTAWGGSKSTHPSF